MPEEHGFLLYKNTLLNNYTLFLQYPEYTGERKEIANEDNQRVFLLPFSKDSKNKDYCVLYKAYKNVPDCILLPMQHSGVIRTTNFLKANLIWKLLKTDKMDILIQKLNKYQRYNHFPCTWQIGRKDNLWRNYSICRNLYGKEHFDYIPHTYLLPEDLATFNLEALPIIKENNVMNKRNFIMKPVASSRGRGVKLVTPCTNIPKKCLISHYISNPHIINNKKYDLRLYVLITNYSPLKIYLYSEGLVRFASEDYDSVNLYNKFMHLTNYSINKESTQFDKKISSNHECIGSKWSLSALRTHFKQNNLNFEELWIKIKDIVVKTVITIEKQTNQKTKTLIKHSNCLFEHYGFDVLIDSNLRPWLMEVNLNPSLNTDTELDLKVKSMLMTDIFNLIGIEPYSHYSDANCNRKGGATNIKSLAHKKTAEIPKVKQSENKPSTNQINKAILEETNSIIKLSEDESDSDECNNFDLIIDEEQGKLYYLS